MGKSINLKVVLVTIILLILVLSQFLPIARVLAATVESGHEFFTGRSDYCSGSLADCDPLVSYKIAPCVMQAAAQGDFYSGAENGGSTSYGNATSNYSLSGNANYLVSDLLAYYYGVNPAADGCAGFVNPQGQSLVLTSDQKYSLDNIGAAFDILEIVDGANVSTSDFQYYSSGFQGSYPYVTLTNGVVSRFISYMTQATTMVCLVTMSEVDNTAMDVSQSTYDVGRTPINTGTRPEYGIISTLATNEATNCNDTNPGDYQDVIDYNCGNLSNVPPQWPKPQPTCPPGDTGVYPNCVGPVPVCTITDSTGGVSPQVGTAIYFYFNWSTGYSSTTPPPSISSVVTSNLSGTNVSPTPSGTYGNTVSNDPLTDTPVNPSSAEAIEYTGTITVGGVQSSPCEDQVTWTSSSGGCAAATAAANAAAATYANDEALTAYDLGTFAPVVSPANGWENAVWAYDDGPYAGSQNILDRVDSTYATWLSQSEATYLTTATYIPQDGDNSEPTGDVTNPNSAQNIYDEDYDTELAECVQQPTCPPGDLGTYPDCYSPPPPTCPPGDTGTYPNCITPPITVPTGPESYFKVSGGDTIVGTGFGPACVDDLNAGIVASNLGSTPWTGASDNLAALAPDIINGFATGAASTSSLADSLTFDNTTNSPYGGSFGSTNGLCSQDFYSTSANVTGFSSLVPATGSFNLSGVSSNTANCLVSNSVSFCSLSNPVQISGSPPSGSRVVLYVAGNAQISGNISIYSSDSSTLTSPSSIPLLYVISNGNIYIDSGVTSIDGVYVADNLQDSDQTDNGIIFTCANAGSSFTSGSALISACNNQLTVNGALVAGQIKFGRTYGDITTANGSPIAPSETINYGPEVWLSQVSTPTSLPINPDYQNISELSPVI